MPHPTDKRACECADRRVREQRERRDDLVDGDLASSYEVAADE